MKKKDASTFKDLWIWQESHVLMLEIHQFTKKLPADERFRGRDQIERSSSSVSANISEGYSAYYYGEKIKHMLIARKEAGETQNHIEVLVDKGYVSLAVANNWQSKYQRIIAGINGYVHYIRGKANKNISSP